MDTPITRAGNSGPAPLSFPQERLWFLQQFEPESTAYSDPILLHFRGSLNVEYLRRAIELVITRHEILRTTYQAKDGIAAQVVQPATRIQLPVFDLSSQADSHLEAQRIQETEFRRTFSLDSDLMIRAIVIRLSQEDYQVLFTINHIATDGWSNGLFLKELGCCYSAFVEGRSPDLPDLPLQYRDFAIWQRQALTDQNLQEHLDYWKSELSGVPAGPQLLTDYPRPAKQTYSGGYLSFPLADDLRDALNEFSRKERVTLFMTIYAAFATLLHRYTDQQTIVVGTPVANRDRVELESLIGFFVNTLALRCDFSGDPTFRELLSRVRETTLSAYSHQELPFEKLVQALRPERSLRHSPIFQTLLAVQNTPAEPLAFSGLSVERKIFERENAQFDLSTFVEFFPSLRIAYSYNTDLFATETIARMARHLENILRSAIANPEERVSRIRILSDSELGQLLAWGQNRRTYPNRCIHDLFEEVAAKTPEKIALVQGSQSITFGQLNQRANRLARDFVDAGVRPGDRVGLLFQRSIEVIVGMLATLKAGAAFVPVDPTYPKARVNFIADDCGIKVFFTETRFSESLPGGSRKVFRAESYREDGPAITNLGLKVSQQDAAYVIFTSGSTGTPKGVEVPQRGIVRLVFGQEYARFGPEQTTLQLCALSFDVSQFEIWASLLHGATCVVFSGQQIDAENIGKDISEHGVVSMWLTTSLFNSVMEQAPSVLEPIKQLLIGGEALSVPHILSALEKLPDTQLINGYGPTENSVFSNCYFIPRDISRNIRSIPIGPPIANTSAFILDRHLRQVPIGVPGELYVGGDGVAIGYVNRPELNAAAFIPNPVAGAIDRRLYKTGDLCRWLPDGTVEYLGRGDGQVKVRGFRVELGEVEAAVKQHPSITNVLAIVWGEGSDRRLVAYVVPSSGDAVRAAEVKDYLRRTLPEYMVPSQFVFLPRLPLLDSGKVDKKALPAPTFSSDEVAEPTDELEMELKKIWEEALGATSIGVNQDFFDLGGHSLLATKLLARVQRSLGVKLPIASLFQAPTITEFANLVRRKSTISAEVPQKRSVRPLFWVGGGVFLRVVSSWLKPEREVIPVGLDMDEWLGLEKPFKVEDIARIIVRHIITQYPEGPYYIGGWCYEGVLAYETAFQLQRENRDVDLLILVDAVTPQSRISMSRFHRIAARFHREVFHLRNLVRLRPVEWMRYFQDRYTEFAEGRKRTHWQKNSSSNQNAVTFEDERNRILHLAMLNYVPSVYRGNLLFCQAANRPAGAYWDLASEWRTLAKGKAEFLEIGGNHVSMLKAPNVDLFATKVRLALDTASEKYRQSSQAATSLV